MTGALPPLWPLALAGLVAAGVLAGLTVRAIVRDLRRPILDEHRAAALLTESRCRVENVTRSRRGSRAGVHRARGPMAHVFIRRARSWLSFTDDTNITITPSPHGGADDDGDDGQDLALPRLVRPRS